MLVILGRMVPLLLLWTVLCSSGFDAVAGQYGEISTRVINGKPTPVNEFIHMALLLRRGRAFCGGSIITNRHVLTAAHCLKYGLSDLKVVVGEHNWRENDESNYTKTMEISELIQHQSYKPGTPDEFLYDIGIVVTIERIEFNKGVGPITLLSNTHPLDLEGKTLKLTGWGRTSPQGEPSDILRSVDLEVISIPECAKMYENSGIYIKADGRTQLCTYTLGKDACRHDSGSPLIYENLWMQAALVIAGDGCAEKGKPGVNIDVRPFIPWIKEQIKIHV